MAGCHPFFIQRVCYVLFEEKIRSADGKVDILDVRNLAYKDLLPHFQDTWDRLSEAQRTILQDEVQQKSNQLRELPELSDSAFPAIRAEYLSGRTIQFDNGRVG